MSEDATLFERGGTEGAAQTGEQYRKTLRDALLERGQEIEGLPWKAGSGLRKGKQRGHFFCAQVGEQVFLRFVPRDGGEIIRELGTCLRMMECDPGTERVVPMDLQQTAFTAWQRALASIHESWMFATDSANLQPKVAKFNRELAEYLREHPSGEISQERLEWCLDAIEAPCPLREQNALREVFNREWPSHARRAHGIVLEVERLGLEPFVPPTPLPPVDPDDVHLICWMAIESVI